jgi:CO/xanthine dehydrogenase FAD-binding subunit
MASYLQARSLEDVGALVSGPQGALIVLAGGTDLMVRERERSASARPSRTRTASAIR